jgi:hypothetical protein
MAGLIDLKALTLSPEKQKSNTVLGTSPESGILLMFSPNIKIVLKDD